MIRGLLVRPKETSVTPMVTQSESPRSYAIVLSHYCFFATPFLLGTFVPMKMGDRQCCIY